MPHQHRIIELLDQAERFRSRLSAGDVNQADLARLHGITRARVTQILNLLRLHPVIVNYLRARGYVGFGRAPTERLLRPLVAMPAEGQLRAAEERLAGFSEYREGRGRGVQGRSPGVAGRAIGRRLLAFRLGRANRGACYLRDRK
jgi:hypothetical protein